MFGHDFLTTVPAVNPARQLLIKLHTEEIVIIGRVKHTSSALPAFAFYPGKGKACETLALPLHKNGNFVIFTSLTPPLK